jgi:hypothetical protein
VPAEIPSLKLLGDFKAYGSRALSRVYGPVASGSWWTRSGSRRPVDTEVYLREVIAYVLYRQELPLLVYGSEEGRIVRGSGKDDSAS